MKHIVHVGNPVLRMKARPLVDEDFESGYVTELAQDMREALAKEKFGVAIASPQIGEPVRMFIVAGKVFKAREGKKESADEYEDQVFINPHIKKVSKKNVVGDEGCLSVPGKYGTKVERPEKVVIEYLNEHNEVFERGAGSFLSRIFQHEIDHLNGVLYIDNALEVIDVDENLKPV